MKRVSKMWCAGVSLLGAVLVAGCGDAVPGKVYPVSGAVRLGVKPLTGGLITFIPDAGNATKYHPTGFIDASGNYTVVTTTASGQANGAPPGKYKVVIRTNTPMMDPAAKPLPIDPKYAGETTTDQTVEVVPWPAAGAYDFQLK